MKTFLPVCLCLISSYCLSVFYTASSLFNHISPRVYCICGLVSLGCVSECLYVCDCPRVSFGVPRTKKFSADLLAWSKYGVGHAWFHWFSHLLFTPIAMTFFLIALSSLPEYITFFLAIIAPILFYRAFRDLTRMPHVSRWPSPLQYGTFLAGGFHSVICYFGKIFEGMCCACQLFI